MKYIKLFYGIVFGALSLILVVVAVYTLTTKSGVESTIVDSQMDQLFYLVMILGGAGLCTAVAVSVLRNSLSKDTTVVFFGLTSALFFFSGLIYHMIFGSPW